ncbi:hypothetical protein CDIK_4319, partial [Cucumispora dikerogammari]
MSLQLIQLAFALKKSFSCSFPYKDKDVHHCVMIIQQPTIDIPVRVGKLDTNKSVKNNPDPKAISDIKSLSLYFVIDLPAWRLYGPKGENYISDVLKNQQLCLRRYKLTTNNKMQLEIDKSEPIVLFLSDESLSTGFKPFLYGLGEQIYKDSVVIGIKTERENQIQGTKSLIKTVQDFRKLLQIDDKDDSEKYIFKFHLIFDVSNSECDCCVSEFELITNGFVISFGEDGCTVKISRFLPPE